MWLVYSFAFPASLVDRTLARWNLQNPFTLSERLSGRNKGWDAGERQQGTGVVCAKYPNYSKSQEPAMGWLATGGPYLVPKLHGVTKPRRIMHCAIILYVV